MAPEAELVLAVLHVPASRLAWLTGAASGELRDASAGSLETLRESATGAAQRVEIVVTCTLGSDHLGELVADSGIDLLVTGARSATQVAALARLRNHCRLPMLLAAGTVSDKAVTRVLCVAPGKQAQRAVGAFLRDHGEPGLHAILLVNAPPARGRLLAALEVAGITAEVKTVGAADASSTPWASWSSRG